MIPLPSDPPRLEQVLIRAGGELNESTFLNNLERWLLRQVVRSPATNLRREGALGRGEYQPFLGGRLVDQPEKRWQRRDRLQALNNCLWREIAAVNFFTTCKLVEQLHDEFQAWACE